MEKVNDWSNLTTVNFVGGLCGDFICSLVYNDYYKIPIKINNSSKVRFDSNVTSQLPMFDSSCFRVIHLLSDLFYHKDSIVGLQKVIENYKSINFIDKHYIMLKKIFDFAYDPDVHQYVSNIQEVCRSIVPGNLKHPAIITHQSFDHNLPGLDMQSIFPGSHNIVLTTSSKDYFSYFRILAYHKYYASNWPNKTLKQSYEDLYQYERDLLDIVDRPYPYHHYDNQSWITQTPIFVDKFLFDDDYLYVEQIEDIFSSNFNRPIMFNKQLILKYRYNNRRIISSYLNSSIDFDYTNKDVCFKANYLIDNISQISSYYEQPNK